MPPNDPVSIVHAALAIFAATKRREVTPEQAVMLLKVLGLNVEFDG